MVIFGVLLVLLGGFAWKLSRSNAPIQENPTATTLPEGEVAAEIMMKEDGYEPADVTIKAGQAIRFINKSSGNRWPASNIHPTHEIYPEFDPKKAIQPGESWAFTFRNKGTWRMHDHLLSYMKGVITVN
jgi:plastocyanin